MQQVLFQFITKLCHVTNTALQNTVVLRLTVQEKTLYVMRAFLSLPLDCSMCKHPVHLPHNQPKRIATTVYHMFSWSFALNRSYKRPLFVTKNKKMTRSQVRENRNAEAT